MAIINNLSASLVSFKINDVSKSFQNSGGTYNTPDLLNGGETYDESTQNILSYVFRIQGLQDHTVKDIVVQSLLLTNTGELSEGVRFVQNLDGKLITDVINGNSTTKVFGSTKFSLNKQIEDSQYEFTYEISNIESKSCIYCLKSITIELSDIKYKIYISFNGPLSGRSVSKIQTSAILQNLEAVDVTFSKDPTKEFDKESDSVEGRAYFRKDGIYVDGYQYGTNQTATTNKFGLVKLVDQVERDEEGIVVPPSEHGIVPTVDLIYNLVQDIQTGVIAPPIATASYLNDNGELIDGTFGIVKLSSNSFDIDEDGGIIPPTETGVAASPQLVYNTLASAINYTDEKLSPIQEFLNGIDAPLDIRIEDNNGEEQSLGEKLIFSNDFEQIDSKLYINWLEII